MRRCCAQRQNIDSKKWQRRARTVDPDWLHCKMSSASKYSGAILRIVPHYRMTLAILMLPVSIDRGILFYRCLFVCPKLKLKLNIFCFPKIISRGFFFSSTGPRPAVLDVMLCALTSILNIFFETTCPILIEFHRNVPAMVLFRIFLKNLIPSKTPVAVATKLKNVQNLWKSFLSENIRLIGTKFGM